MFESWKISWRYFKKAWKYIKDHPKLFKIPLLAAGLCLAIIIPIILSLVVEIFWYAHNPSTTGLNIILASLILDFLLILFFIYVIAYVYQGMIVAAVYASEIGREEGLLDNLKGNWGALFKFALLTTLFSLVISHLYDLFGKAPLPLRLLSRTLVTILAKIYQFLTVFTVCAIVIEELPMSKALKRSVSLVRKNPVPAIFGVIISDIIGTVGMVIIFVGLFGFVGLGVLLEPIIGPIAWGISASIFLILFMVGIFVIALLGSLVTNVYYSLVYLEALRKEGSSLLRGGEVSLPLGHQEMESVLRAKSGMSYRNILEHTNTTIDWWERKASRWLKRWVKD